MKNQKLEPWYETGNVENKLAVAKYWLLIYLMKSYVDLILKCETFACVRETEKRVKRQTKNVINEWSYYKHAWNFDVKIDVKHDRK